jgi:hypothetical protein
MKILAVVIFIILIVLIYVLYKLLSKTTTKVSGFSDASITINGASQPKTQNNAFSFWFYISSWTSGQKQPLITLIQESKTYMSAKLDEANNTLIIEIKSTTTPVATVATVNITDIRLQKWNHIIISVNGNVVDVYLDGKLVKTKIASSIPSTTTSEFKPTIGGSGNKGFISSALYKNDYITPEEAWNIYSMGYTGAGLFDFVNRYKLNFSITKDDQEAVSFSV